MENINKSGDKKNSIFEKFIKKDGLDSTIFDKILNSQNTGKIKKTTNDNKNKNIRNVFQNGFFEKPNLLGFQKNKEKIDVSEKLYEHIRNAEACVDEALNDDGQLLDKDKRDRYSQALFELREAMKMIKKTDESDK